MAPMAKTAASLSFHAASSALPKFDCTESTKRSILSPTKQCHLRLRERDTQLHSPENINIHLPNYRKAINILKGHSIQLITSNWKGRIYHSSFLTLEKKRKTKNQKQGTNKFCSDSFKVSRPHSGIKAWFVVVVVVDSFKVETSLQMLSSARVLWERISRTMIIHCFTFQWINETLKHIFRFHNFKKVCKRSCYFPWNKRTNMRRRNIGRELTWIIGIKVGRISSPKTLERISRAAALHFRKFQTLTASSSWD